MNTPCDCGPVPGAWPVGGEAENIAGTKAIKAMPIIPAKNASRRAERVIMREKPLHLEVMPVSIVKKSGKEDYSNRSALTGSTLVARSAGT